MDAIATRAEQAVLGALIARPDATPPRGLTAAHFTDPRHQAIYAAATGAMPKPAGLIGWLRARLATLPWRREVRDMHAYLQELPGLCPDPDNLDRYAAVVAEARARSGISAEHRDGSGRQDLDRLAGAAAYLASQTRRGRNESRMGTPSPVQSLAEALYQRLAGKVQGRPPVNTGPPASPDRRNVPVVPGARPASRSGQPESAPAAGEPRNAAMQAGPLSAAHLEELVLAGLMRHPAEAEDITRWLPATVFTAPWHRAVYETILALAADTTPPDPLLVAWRARQSADAEAILPIAAIPVAPGTAAAVGRGLLADRLCTRHFGDNWPRNVNSLAAPDREPKPARAPAGPVSEEPPESPLAPSAATVPADTAAPQRPIPVMDPPPPAAPDAPVPRM